MGICSYRLLATDTMLLTESSCQIYALIHLTEIIKKYLDDDNNGCRIYFFFKNPFDNVDHDILSK